MARAYSYIRFSTPEQRLGDSLRRQLEAARVFAAANGLDLDETLRDEGRSAFSGKQRDDKAALGRFLAMVENGRISRGSYLLVESLDRLSREQVLDALRLFTTIVEAGIIIVTLKDKKIYSRETINANPMDLMFSIMIMMRGHEESAVKSFRLGEVWAKKRQDAAKTGRAMTAICPAWLRKRGDRYEPIPERTAVVEQIFRECIQGAGTRTIAKRLNQAGIAPWGRGKRQGRLWYDSYVKKILENPAVIGEFTPRGPLAGGSEVTAGLVLKNYYPPVIDAETFWKARAALKARRSSHVRSSAGKHRNVLSGLLRCGVCGAGMHYIDKGRSSKAGKPYLQCGSSLLRGGCDHSQRYTYEAVEGHVLINLSSTTGIQDAEADSIAALELAYHEAEARLSRMLDLVERGIGGDQSIQRAAAADKELAQARKALEAAREREEVIRARGNLRTGQIEMARIALRLRERPDDSELRLTTANMLRSALKTVTLSPGRIAFTFAWSEQDAISWAIRPGFDDEVTAMVERFADNELRQAEGSPS